jgi:hypothetical protein
MSNKRRLYKLRFVPGDRVRIAVRNSPKYIDIQGETGTVIDVDDRWYTVKLDNTRLGLNGVVEASFIMVEGENPSHEDPLTLPPLPKGRRLTDEERYQRKLLTNKIYQRKKRLTEKAALLSRVSEKKIDIKDVSKENIQNNIDSRIRQIHILEKEIMNLQIELDYIDSINDGEYSAKELEVYKVVKMAQDADQQLTPLQKTRHLLSML